MLNMSVALLLVVLWLMLLWLRFLLTNFDAYFANIENIIAWLIIRYWRLQQLLSLSSYLNDYQYNYDY